MNREVHVRIWERPEAILLRATRQLLPNQDPAMIGWDAPIPDLAGLTSEQQGSTLSRPSA
jgi:hypothetical protein